MASVSCFDCLPNDIIGHIHRYLDGKSRAKFKVARASMAFVEDSAFDRKLYLSEKYIGKYIDHQTKVFSATISEFLKSSLLKQDDMWIQELCKQAKIAVPLLASSTTTFIPSVDQFIFDIKKNKITKERVQLYQDAAFDFETDDYNIIMLAIAGSCTGKTYEMLIESDKIKQVVVQTCNRRGPGDFIVDIVNCRNEDLLRHIISTPATMNIIDMNIAKSFIYSHPLLVRFVLLSRHRTSHAAFIISMFLQYFEDIPLGLLVKTRDTAEEELDTIAYFLLNTAIDKRVLQ
jgi:hypothetical protein